MCLIIVGKAETLRATLLDTPGLLADIYRSNPDGIGIMYASVRGLRIFKKLPKNSQEARHFLSRMPGDERNLAVHFRWTTHGHTNKDNCHPYTVVEGECAMMHNGVLRTGNSADTSKSDTWHFIKDYLQTGVAMAPGLVHDAGFRALVKDFIGNTNRFVFMTNDGQVSIVNSKEGIEHNGLWFSNTYAWSPGLLIPGRHVKYGGYQGGYQGGYRGGWEGYDYDGYDLGSYSRGGTQSGNTKSTTSSSRGGVTHLNGATAATRFTREDAAEEEAWQRAVAKSKQQGIVEVGTKWTAASSIAAGHQARAGSAGTSGPANAEQEATAQDATQGTSSGSVHSFGGPVLESMTSALLDADVELFERWLGFYPRATLLLLFRHFTASPTKWCTADGLDGYAAFLYDALINEDFETLVKECDDRDSGHDALAETICYYLNWEAVDPVAKAVAKNQREAAGVIETVEPGGPIVDYHSEAQTGQGGEDARDDGFASINIGV